MCYKDIKSKYANIGVLLNIFKFLKGGCQGLLTFSNKCVDGVNNTSTIIWERYKSNLEQD